MEMTGEQRLPAPRERVWAALLDPETLRAAIPGCESVRQEGSGGYSVSVVAAVGPVKARFKGRMQQMDLQPPHRYTLSFEGDGGMAGFARGSAQVELTDDGASGTLLAYRAQAQIGGRLAQIGSRLVDATAARMSAHFFERLVHTITVPPAASLPVEGMAAAAGMPPSFAPGLAPAAALAGARLAPEAGMVTVSMPAWAWSFTIAVGALLAAWISTR